MHRIVLDVNVNVNYKPRMRATHVPDIQATDAGSASKSVPPKPVPPKSALKSASLGSQDSWGIADTALHFEITTRALRFYEDKGLLTPSRANGRRLFSALDRKRLEKILRAKRIGFSLEDIKQFLDVTDGLVTEIDELRRRKTSFEAVITRLRRKRKDIEIISKDMQDLCTIIDNHMESAPTSGVFQFAEAYDAMFRAHLDEDFIPV